MPRIKRLPRKKRTKTQRLAYLNKQLVIWNSQIRVDHEKVAELEDRIALGERIRDETLRAIDNLN